VAFLFNLFLINSIELGNSLVSYLCISLLFYSQSLSCHLTNLMWSQSLVKSRRWTGGSVSLSVI
jgi:hypothetical protein